MKKTMILAGLVATASLDAAVIEQVIVRQQWPWSTDVKVEYKVTGVTSPVNIAVRAFNGEEELSSANLEASISGERYGIAEDGVGTFVIDPVKAFGTSKVALANFKVKLSLTEAASNINEVIYKVFDLSTGACQDITRADFYNGKVEDGDYVTDYTSLHSRFLAPSSEMVGDVLVWTGVTNNVKYKTTHLVMRKIPAANKVWCMGAPMTERGYRAQTETNHLVKLTQNYYIGVFELTQRQYTLITGQNGSLPDEQAREEADVLPVSGMKFGNVGVEKTVLYAVAKLRQNTGLEGFNLPTEAQWEFACRAGSDTGLYSGRQSSSSGLWSGCDTDVDLLAWFAGNSSGTKVVGLKLPNAFGLYDMLGNVREWALDMYSEYDAYVASFGAGWQPGDVVVDPTGPAQASVTVSGSTDVRTLRGGHYGLYPAMVRNCSRIYNTARWQETKTNDSGMRVILAITE